jgi:hypothetical protein
VILFGVVLAVIVGRLRGGSPAGLANHGIKGLALVWVALALRLAIDLLAKWDIELAWLQFPAYILFFCVLGLNLAQPGIKTFTCGTALNFLAIAANGGAMPVSAGAIELAGLAGTPAGTHVLLSENTKLWFLTDVIPLHLPFLPLGQVISIGDILITCGIFIFIQHKMLSGEKSPPGEETAC